MINLLPHGIKTDIAYARRNSRLRKWIIASVAALAGMCLIVGGGYLYMQQSIHNYSDQRNAAQAKLDSQNVAGTQKQIDEISNGTKLATQVLSREVLFSELIRSIASALPDGTTLKTLQIDQVQGGVQLDAEAASFDAGTQLQVNLQDPTNGVFEKADINNITCDPAAQGKVYPCQVSLRALFNKNNSYTYIAPSTGGSR